MWEYEQCMNNVKKHLTWILKIHRNKKIMNQDNTTLENLYGNFV